MSGGFCQQAGKGAGPRNLQVGIATFRAAVMPVSWAQRVTNRSHCPAPVALIAVEGHGARRDRHSHILYESEWAHDGTLIALRKLSINRTVLSWNMSWKRLF